MVDFLFVIIAFFAISDGQDVISRNLSKSAFFEGVCPFEHKFQTGGGVVHQQLLRKLE